MEKILVIQPHSDDAILSCATFLLDSSKYETVVLTIEKNPKRVKEDNTVAELIDVEFVDLGLEIHDDHYSSFFSVYGKKVVLSEDNVSEFYLEKLGFEKIEEIVLKLNEVIDDYKSRGFKIVCPLGIGHPFHLLVRKMILDESGLIYYREFPHSYKKKAQEQFNNELNDIELFLSNDDEDFHEIKFDVARKAYKSQSAFFFYEKGYIDKKIAEEFYTTKNVGKHIKIYVISKGRPNGKTFDLLKRGGASYSVVVEPQDYDKYKEAGHENILTLPENDRGFSYTVNFAKNQFDGINPVVIMDDDIMNFYYSVPGIPKISLSLKTAEELNEYFKVMDEEICSTDFDYGTIGKSAFDWGHVDVSPRMAYDGSKLKYSGIPVVIIINNSELLKMDFDETLYLKSDIDFSLRCMYAGFKYAKFVHFLQQTKMNKDAKQKGGLAETYKRTELINKTHDILMKRWPHNIVEDIKKKSINGVCELKIIYKKFEVV